MAPASDVKSSCKHSGPPLKGRNVHVDAPDKATLLSVLHLVPQLTFRKKQEVKRTEVPIELRNELLAKRGQVKSYFKSNPLPISSSLGRKIIDQASVGARILLLKLLATISTAALTSTNTNLLYTIGSRQRVTRNVELTLGVSAKSFPMLNKCRGFSIQGHKMSDQDIAQAIQSLQNPAQVQDSGKALTESTLPVRRWIASERTAGPSRGFERIAGLVVLLDDRNLAPLYARYIS